MPADWRKAVEMSAAAEDAPIQPAWTMGGVPNCSEHCRYHDGKRCELLGFRLDGICEPAVLHMANMLTRRNDDAG